MRHPALPPCGTTSTPPERPAEHPVPCHTTHPDSAAQAYRPVPPPCGTTSELPDSLAGHLAPRRTSYPDCSAPTHIPAPPPCDTTSRLLEDSEECLVRGDTLRPN